MSVKERVKRLERQLKAEIPEECYIIVADYLDENDLSKYTERRVKFWDWHDGKTGGSFQRFDTGGDNTEVLALLDVIDAECGIERTDKQ